MNSIPADSSASLIAKSVRTCPEGTPVIASIRLTVADPMPDLLAKSVEDQRKRALAARICPLVINSKYLYYDAIGINKMNSRQNSTARHVLEAVLIKIEDAYARNSIRAYRADWLDFLRFCDLHGLCALPASPQAVASYIQERMSAGLKSASIRRKMNSIGTIHRWSELPNPMHHPEVQLALRKMYRRLGRRSRQAYGLTAELIERLVEATGDDLRGLRDRALLRLAHETLLRRQELVSLRVQDIHWRGDGSAALMLRRSKTDQGGVGRWIFATDKSALSVREWLTAAGHSNGLLFRGVARGGALTDSLHPGYVAMRLKRLAQRAGLEEQVVRHISGHSPRVGGAQDLMMRGASLVQIMAIGGWKKTDTVMNYVQRIIPSSVMAPASSSPTIWAYDSSHLLPP